MATRADGRGPGLVSDGTDKLFMVVGASVYRYAVSTGVTTLLASGFSFCPARTNAMYLSPTGDLMWGDDTSCGVQPGTGRIWRLVGAGL